MTKWIISAALLALTVLFAALKNVFAAAQYLALGFGCALALMWTVIWIVDYFVTYQRKNLQERYDLYCAVLVNSSALTLDLIKQHDKRYYKKFKRTLIKEKLVAWLKIFLAAGVTIALFFVFL